MTFLAIPSSMGPVIGLLRDLLRLAKTSLKSLMTAAASPENSRSITGAFLTGPFCAYVSWQSGIRMAAASSVATARSFAVIALSFLDILAGACGSSGRAGDVLFIEKLVQHGIAIAIAHRSQLDRLPARRPGFG